MKIVFFGKGTRARLCLETMTQSGFAPVGVLAENADEELLETAVPMKIPVITAPSEIAPLKPDLTVLCSYTKILKEPLISLPRLGTINLHGGKVPEYRGASVLNWQIINGEAEGGVSILCVDKGIDTGDILAEARFPIYGDDTINDAVRRTNEIFPLMLVETLANLDSGTAVRKPQPAVGVYWHKRVPEDGALDWKNMRAVDVYNLTRALTKPYPGAFGFINDRKVFIWQTRMPETFYRGVPGKIARRDGNDIIVIARDQGLLLTQWEVEGLSHEESQLFLLRKTGASFNC